MSLKSIIKTGLGKATTLPGVRGSLRRMMRRDAVIFMVHRFRNEKSVFAIPRIPRRMKPL